MFHVFNIYEATNKHKIKFLHKIMSSTNAVCIMCREYAENELQRL